MVMIAYRIAKLGDAWPVTRNGEPTMDYPTQEAALNRRFSPPAGIYARAIRCASKSPQPQIRSERAQVGAFR